MKAILPIFDESRQRPYYLQLYDYLKEAILSGDIAEGEKLPSLRSLSRSTGFSLTTVENAYNQLLVEGYISSRASSGYYADEVRGTDLIDSGTNQVRGTNQRDLSTNQVRGETVQQPRGAGNNAGSDKATRQTTDEGRRDSVPCTAGQDAPGTEINAETDRYSHGTDGPATKYDPECFDFNKWKKCMNRVLNEKSPALFFEGDPQGEADLRIQIANYLYRSRGVACGIDQIFLGAGTQQITGLLATILKDLDIENVSLEMPGYAPVRKTFKDRGFAITDIAVDENGIILENLPINIRSAAYVSPSNNAFTGSLMPVGRRYEMIRWAMSNDSYIIEDDYDSELRYFGRPIPPIRSLTDEGRVIYLGSFSSTLFAAVRISYMVLPAHIARSFSAQLGGYSQTCSKLEQLSLANFMETGLYQTHIRKLRKLYSQKLSAATDVLRKNASDFVEIKNNASGISLLLKVGTASTGDPVPSSSNPDASTGEPVPSSSNPDASTGEPDEITKKLIKDAESLGIPAVFANGLLQLSYNQIPLSEIPETFQKLIDLWRS